MGLVCLAGCLSLLALFFQPNLLGQDFLTFVSGPTNALSAGAPLSVWVHLLNSSPAPQPARFPTVLQARLKAGAISLLCQLNPVGGAMDQEVSVAPGAFARREYSALLPSLPPGPATLEIANLTANALTLKVVEAPQKVSPATQGREERQSEGPSKSAFEPVDFFHRHFFPYDPLYFIAGPDSPNGKFQFSFKYKMLDAGPSATSPVSLVTNLYFGYTQTSLWDLSKASSPFSDTSYKPEAFYYQSELLPHPPGWLGLGFQTGYQHESNGKDGDDSRSLNLAYIKPIVRLGYADRFHATLAPRAWFYVGDLDDNPDLPRYRGYFEFQTVVGWPESLQLRTLVRVGDAFDRASLTLDLSYPVWKLGVKVPWYLYAQYFIGYGESLLDYRERSSTVRFGLAVYR
jgi:phospholipase A1/A2